MLLAEVRINELSPLLTTAIFKLSTTNYADKRIVSIGDDKIRLFRKSVVLTVKLCLSFRREESIFSAL